LRALTQKLGIYATLLKTYLDISGEFDFIKAKAKLAIYIGGNFTLVNDRAHIQLVNAYHPLLLLYNQRTTSPLP
jgi:DNA mismatch repair protein MutS2